ncbi:MAG TPA: DUF302 domain-containing protein [Hyphomicrobiaceae bacterium]|nr:DUF302 domain-containing protein [Hyphomicrobiaceae bacterium]
MHYFSKSVRTNFEDAVGATRQALEAHHLKILAEIDLRDPLRRYLTADFRPYLILSACSLPLAHRAIQANDNIGSILLCNVVVQQREEGHVDISAVDPDATIGTINDVDLMWTTRELRSLVQQAIDDVETLAEPQDLPRHSEAADRPLGWQLGRTTAVSAA